MARTKARASRGRSRSRKYPHFVREDDILVRIGWSEIRQSEYVILRAPLYVLEDLVSSILDVRDSSNNFQIEHLLPLRDVENGDISYRQARLALLWLVSAELVGKFGPSHYFVPDKVDLLNDMDKRWKRIPIFRAAKD